MLVALLGIIVYRLFVNSELINYISFSYASTVATITGSSLSYIVVLVLGILYKLLAKALNKWGKYNIFILYVELI